MRAGEDERPGDEVVAGRRGAIRGRTGSCLTKSDASRTASCVGWIVAPANCVCRWIVAKRAVSVARASSAEKGDVLALSGQLGPVYGRTC